MYVKYSEKGNYHHSTNGILIVMLCMVMSIGILEKSSSFIQFTAEHPLVYFMYLISCSVTYVMKEKKSNTDILYAIFSKHLIYEGSLR